MNLSNPGLAHLWGQLEHLPQAAHWWRGTLPAGLHCCARREVAQWWGLTVWHLYLVFIDFTSHVCVFHKCLAFRSQFRDINNRCFAESIMLEKKKHLSHSSHDLLPRKCSWDCNLRVSRAMVFRDRQWVKNLVLTNYAFLLPYCKNAFFLCVLKILWGL